MKEKKVVFYHCYTPMHIGSGTTLGLIDLPIQREAHTDFPVMPSSAIKGVVRAEYEKSHSEEEAETLFGNQEGEGNVIFTDGKILLFPVKSLKGIFVWITSPLVLDRLQRDLGINLGFDIPSPTNKQAFVSSNVPVLNNKLTLEEFTFEAKTLEDLKKLKTLTNTEIDENKIVLLSDDIFKFFVKNYTEVNARIKIDQAKGTVAEGGLWYEELLPAETIFYGALVRRGQDQHLNTVTEFIKNKTFQFGADETLGRGFTKIVVED